MNRCLFKKEERRQAAISKRRHHVGKNSTDIKTDIYSHFIIEMKKPSGAGDGSIAAHRWNVASRTLLAIAGGYVMAALATASLSLALPLPRAQAVMAATLFSFALYCVLIIWAYSANTATRAWTLAALWAAVPAGHLALRWATA